MNAITEALVARELVTSQQGLPQSTPRRPQRARPTMAWQIDDKTGRPVARWVIRQQPALSPLASTHAKVHDYLGIACNWLSEHRAKNICQED